MLKLHGSNCVEMQIMMANLNIQFDKYKNEWYPLLWQRTIINTSTGEKWSILGPVSTLFADLSSASVANSLGFSHSGNWKMEKTFQNFKNISFIMHGSRKDTGRNKWYLSWNISNKIKSLDNFQFCNDSPSSIWKW